MWISRPTFLTSPAVIPSNYTDTSSFGYEFEETNYDPNYNSYASSMAGDNGDFDYGDIMDQMGYEQSIND